MKNGIEVDMMSDTQTRSSGGIGFAGLLTIVFITLKLTHVITWSWWWVLSPLWISIGLFVFFLLIILVAWLFTRPKGGGGR